MPNGAKRVFESPLPPFKGGRAKRRERKAAENLRPVGFPLLRGCPSPIKGGRGISGGFEDPHLFNN